VSYGSLLAAFAAVMIVDYWVLRRTQLDVEELYKPEGAYTFSRGYNPRALVAVLAGVLPVVPGFLQAATTEGGVVAEPDFLDQLYRYGIFVTFAIAAGVYFALSVAGTARGPAPAIE
jgi:nucleobase:cation symporter-1, NCS1 family